MQAPADRVGSTPAGAQPAKVEPGSPSRSQGASPGDDAAHARLDVRPAVTAFSGALAAAHAGDVEPLRELLATDARWLRPVADREPRDRDAVVAALSRGVTETTRILDLGAGGFAAQLGTRSGNSTIAIVDVADGSLTAMRTYGADPQVDARASPPTDPGAAAVDASLTALVGGRPNLRHVALTQRLYEAASARAWSKIESTLARGATHETHGDTTPEAAPAHGGFVPSLAELLAEPDARITVRRQHAVGDYVLVEAVVGRGKGVTQRPVVGFVDVLRLDEGRIVASWRWLNHRPPA